MVAVEDSGIEIETRPGEPILVALCRRGYTYKYGCRRGGCGVCKVHLVSGQVVYPKVVAETVLSEADRRGGSCLSCRAVPVTDVVIRLGAGDSLHSVALFLSVSNAKCGTHPHAKGIEGK